MRRTTWASRVKTTFWLMISVIFRHLAASSQGRCIHRSGPSFAVPSCPGIGDGTLQYSMLCYEIAVDPGGIAFFPSSKISDSPAVIWHRALQLCELLKSTCREVFFIWARLALVRRRAMAKSLPTRCFICTWQGGFPSALATRAWCFSSTQRSARRLAS